MTAVTNFLVLSAWIHGLLELPTIIYWVVIIYWELTTDWTLSAVWFIHMNPFILIPTIGGGVYFCSYFTNEEHRLERLWREWRINMWRTIMTPEETTDRIINGSGLKIWKSQVSKWEVQEIWESCSPFEKLPGFQRQCGQQTQHPECSNHL